jgi:hypothetical protein
VCTAYVPSQQRCYLFFNSGGNTANLEWLDLTSGAYVTGTGTTLEMDLSDGGSDSSATTFPVPQRNLVVMCYRKAGVLAIQYLDTTLSQPTAVTATLSDAALPLLSIWSCATWCSHSSRVIVAGVTGNTDAMYEITIPATLTDPWTVTRAALGGGQTFVPVDVSAGSASSFGKFEYDEKVRAIVYLGRAERSSPDTVSVYRPRNT